MHMQLILPQNTVPYTQWQQHKSFMNFYRTSIFLMLLYQIPKVRRKSIDYIYRKKEPLADMPWDKYYFIIGFKQASKHIRWTTQFQNWNVFCRAKTAIEQLGELYEKALLEVGRSSAMIFQIHQMMLEDVDYVGSITNMIQNQGQNAEYAVSVTAAKFANMFATMDDPYMRERSADVKDISQRLINVLTHNHDGVISFEKACHYCR